MISVCFRFDDPSPIGDKEVEHGALEIFARHDIPLCVGAIPFARVADGGAIVLSPQNATSWMRYAREPSKSRSTEIRSYSAALLPAACPANSAGFHLKNSYD